MKSFKIYLKNWKARTQLKWASALLIIVGVVMAGVNALYYFTYPETEAVLEELGFSMKGFFLKQIWIAAALCGIGLIVLLASMFVGGKNHY